MEINRAVSAFVMMTNRCSMNCSYCFERETFRKSSKDMSLEVANKTSDFLLNAAKGTSGCDVVSFTYFGGEPLLNWEIIKKNILYNKKLEKESGIKFEMDILTNAYRLPENTEDFFKTIKENDISIQASLDGCRESHNAARGHFDEIVKNIKKIIEGTGKLIIVRMTVTPENSKYIYESFKTMIGLSNKIATSLIVEGNWTDKAINEVRGEFKKTINYYNNKYAKRNVGFNIVRSLNKGCVTTCKAGDTFVGISVDGDIYPCHRFITFKDHEKWKMGSVFETNITRKDLSYCMKKCESCACTICTPCPAAFLSIKEQSSPEGYCKACKAIEEVCRPIAERIFIRNQLDAQNKVLRKLTELNVRMAECIIKKES